MCGFSGLIDFSRQTGATELSAIITRMSNALAHRGPDDSGEWVDPAAGIALGHRRLSIVDLSPEGHQPMSSICGRYLINFNGEIYNYGDIRDELDRESKRIWHGRSDTEVMLEAIRQWGLEKAVQRFSGMFAFALWDRELRLLSLVRDRLGEKPLYYGWQGKTFLFGSELKALKAHPDFQGEINRDAVTLLLRHNCIPSPYSIYKGIYKLPPGTWLEVPSGNGMDVAQSATPHPYWSLRDVVHAGYARPFSGTDTEAVQEMEALLGNAIRGQRVADVPLGAFLSGGVDSSAVVALMQQQAGRSVKTFTIGFQESRYNEAEDAKKVARHLGTEHFELYFSPQEAMGVISKLPALYDEPFSDSSQIPTFIVAQMARQHVTASLSGDGGDELFCGYNRYFQTCKIWNKIRAIPLPLRGLMARIIRSVSPQRLDQVVAALSSVMPGELTVGMAGDKLHKLAELLDKKSSDELYQGLMSHWKSPTVLNADEPTIIVDQPKWGPNDLMSEMMYQDIMTYLPNDILAKTDRAAMGVSLETRMPFLDHNLIEFAWRLPFSFKVRNGQTKWILRQVLYKYVPKELIERPKMGFEMPIDIWLRIHLRDWAEALLDENRLRQEGFFKPEPIREKWAEHLSGKRNWQHHLWDVLMFQLWLENQV